MQTVCDFVIPTFKDLERAYFELQSPSKTPCNPQKWALYGSWTRFDARLAEIWVGRFSKDWRTILPLDFRKEILKSPWPAAIAVLLEHVRQQESPLYKKELSLWIKLVSHGFQKAHFEQFFIGQRKLAGKQMFLDAQLATIPYLKWGYLGREVLINKAKSKMGKLPKSARLQVIQTLLKNRKSFGVRDYYGAIEGCISMRQAERDLISCSGLKVSGNTKARIYRAKKKF